MKLTQNYYRSFKVIMPAPRGNKFNLKKPKDRKTAFLKVFGTEKEKKSWEKKAQKENKKAATWAREILNTNSK